MAKGIGHFILIIKAIFTRVLFATHGLIAIWRVTTIKKDPYYWYLCASILALTFEGVFTLTIKKNQEWKWFCPSVFFYLCSVVPSIWLLEVDKFDKKLALKLAGPNITKVVQQGTGDPEVLNAINALENLNIPGVKLNILKELDSETWATVIEQLLMLILIIGRWMLPKGGLTRDQLSQLLLVYIGTAADIIEFFDSFKDDKIASQRVLCLLILSIWSWSLLQFTFVLTATKARRTRLTADIEPPKPKFVNGIYKVKEVCCSIDVWAILINIILQDAPFLIFRMLLITYYKIISYMNIFFTAKNTLVIILQFYRLYVVQQEKNKELKKMAKATISGNLAKAVERAAFMGPTTDSKVNKSGRGVTAGPSKSQGNNIKKTQAQVQGKPATSKHRSQESIASQSQAQVNQAKVLEAARRERAKTGRRKSLSTSNLPAGIEETFTQEREERISEDDFEMGLEGSVLSGTNDADSQEESEVPLDEVSVTSERPPTRENKKTRMSENPGIYKISGSRSSEGSSQQGHVRARQDTGYSSSSKDSANSSRRGRIANGGSRTGRGNNRKNLSRTAAQRRRQMIISRQLNSELGGIMEHNSSEDSEEALAEEERIFQRRAAICAVFSLFVVIFVLCQVAIYGGINPRGLVLRETFRVVNSTKPKTTTTTTTPAPPSPTTEEEIETSPPPLIILLTITNTSTNTNISNDTIMEDDIINSTTNSYSDIRYDTTLKDSLLEEINNTTLSPLLSTMGILEDEKRLSESRNVESSTTFPSERRVEENEISHVSPSIPPKLNEDSGGQELPSDFVRHSRRKMKLLYGYVNGELGLRRRWD